MLARITEIFKILFAEANIQLNFTLSIPLAEYILVCSGMSSL